MPQEEPDPDLSELSSEDERDRLSPSPLEWKFSQVFGERVAGEEVQEVDIISAIEFDKSGDHLATGDRGGRVVLFERTDSRNLDSRMNMERQDYSTSRHPEFFYKTEFQSHEPEFDYLKSLEIEEKINKIRWHQTSNGSLFLLSTNDKTIKYWKTFISADDMRINLWNLEISNQSFNIVDVKPQDMEDLTEVITSAEFHPIHCNMLAYSSSRGSIRLIDLRQSALCDSHSMIFQEHEVPGSRSFFTEIIASISDIKFSKDGRHILGRDYMTLKLCDLYENDSILDKFESCLSGDGLRVATGSYSNEAATLEATKNPLRRVVQNPTRLSRSLSSLTRDVRQGAESPGIEANGIQLRIQLPVLLQTVCTCIMACTCITRKGGRLSQ